MDLYFFIFDQGLKNPFRNQFKSQLKNQLKSQLNSISLPGAQQCLTPPLPLALEPPAMSGASQSLPELHSMSALADQAARIRSRKAGYSFIFKRGDDSSDLHSTVT